MECSNLKIPIVITSIHSPTEAIISLSKMDNYYLLVVGDKKTPLDWELQNTNFLSIKDQKTLGFELSKFIPYNHYSRKMLGYLTAISKKACYIIETDDDNIPLKNWNFPPFEGIFDISGENLDFVNIYKLFTDNDIWPRGLPLNHINRLKSFDIKLLKRPCKIGVWQGLADENPDVDAIYNLTNNKPCFFKHRDPVVLGKGSICPFNSQNTMIIKDLFPLLYLPSSVTFRYTDILRSIVAQPIMWLYDYHLGFFESTVHHNRNPHNLIEDFISEIPMYRTCEDAMAIVKEEIKSSESIESNLFISYQALAKKKIVKYKELRIVEVWLKDLHKIQNH